MLNRIIAAATAASLSVAALGALADSPASPTNTVTLHNATFCVCKVSNVNGKATCSVDHRGETIYVMPNTVNGKPARGTAPTSLMIGVGQRANVNVTNYFDGPNGGPVIGNDALWDVLLSFDNSASNANHLEIKKTTPDGTFDLIQVKEGDKDSMISPVSTSFTCSGQYNRLPTL